MNCDYKDTCIQYKCYQCIRNNDDTSGYHPVELEDMYVENVNEYVPEDVIESSRSDFGGARCKYNMEKQELIESLKEGISEIEAGFTDNAHFVFDKNILEILIKCLENDK